MQKVTNTEARLLNIGFVVYNRPVYGRKRSGDSNPIKPLFYVVKKSTLTRKAARKGNAVNDMVK